MERVKNDPMEPSSTQSSGMRSSTFFCHGRIEARCVRRGRGVEVDDECIVEKKGVSSTERARGKDEGKKERKEGKERRKEGGGFLGFQHIKSSQKEKRNRKEKKM